MKLIFNKIFLAHNNEMHPENASRLKLFKDLPETKLKSGEEFLSLAHSKEQIELVRRASQEEKFLDADTYTSKKSFEAACFAVSAAIKASEVNGFALVRPPGHHAESNHSMGFCLFNNIAIASKKLLNEGKRVFVVDFDLHHGNGTQEILAREKNCIYFSTHQSPMYPGTGLRDEGNALNVPLPFGCSDDTYIEALNEKLFPAIKAFNPDIVAVSAGFDSFYMDFQALRPDAGFRITEKSFQRIKEILKPFPQFFVLEGGYKPESVFEGVNFFLK